ncbi:hypothetical protein [Vaginella massiliensis]|uniref:hypothetical protein n=1 Tax=Vaginella massiliensis TaxID=1816680 RepID=UPI0012B50B03|nr:hypothetical protein [Vaginella massiliensis]
MSIEISISSALGSLGTAAFGGVMESVNLAHFAESTAGMVTFGALSGGVGSALSGGNFFEGALIGGVVAGLNDAMHKHLNGGDGRRKVRVTKRQNGNSLNPKGSYVETWNNKNVKRGVEVSGFSSEVTTYYEVNNDNKTANVEVTISGRVINKTNPKGYLNYNISGENYSVGEILITPIGNVNNPRFDFQTITSSYDLPVVSTLRFNNVPLDSILTINIGLDTGTILGNSVISNSYKFYIR